MQKESILSLFDFERAYLSRMMENISEELLYAKQDEGINSAGWLMGHLCVEIQDVLDYFKIEYPKWSSEVERVFRMGSKGEKDISTLPQKKELLKVFNLRYDLAKEVYLNADSALLAGPHPSKFLGELVPDLDAWIIHHLVPHLAIHAGNLSVWKKLVGLEVNGY